MKLPTSNAVLLSVVLTCSAADVGKADSPYHWKVTAGEYAYAGYAGTDMNLRWRDADTDAWLGVYGDRVFGTQVRTGLDTSVQLGKYLQVQPSLQLASRGFVGGSITLQAGAAWYGIAGLGRTDARSYFNLNFDPNDAITLGAGHTAASGFRYLIFVVADNRFHTGQRDWHVNAELPFGAGHATLDLLRKTGTGDSGEVRAWGVTANYDWPRWFMRVAYDPAQNFSSQNAWRLASGFRF